MPKKKPTFNAIAIDIVYRKQLVDPETTSHIGIICFTGQSFQFIAPTNISNMAIRISMVSITVIITEKFTIITVLKHRISLSDELFLASSLAISLMSTDRSRPESASRMDASRSIRFLSGKNTVTPLCGHQKISEGPYGCKLFFWRNRFLLSAVTHQSEQLDTRKKTALLFELKTLFSEKITPKRLLPLFFKAFCCKILVVCNYGHKKKSAAFELIQKSFTVRVTLSQKLQKRNTYLLWSHTFSDLALQRFKRLHSITVHFEWSARDHLLRLSPSGQFILLRCVRSTCVRLYDEK